MDALEFIKAIKQMLSAGANNSTVQKYISAYKKNDCEGMVEAAEQWAAEHSIKTRQSVFLEQFPNVRLDTNEIIDISPCRVDPKQYPFNGKDCCKFRSCGECRREFWMQEVEE